MQNNIRVLRAMRNITQEELAGALGVTRQTIIAIENEKYNPSLELAFKIAAYFKTSIDETFQYKPWASFFSAKAIARASEVFSHAKREYSSISPTRKLRPAE